MADILSETKPKSEPGGRDRLIDSSQGQKASFIAFVTHVSQEPVATASISESFDPHCKSKGESVMGSPALDSVLRDEVYSNLTETNFETPTSCIVTP